MSWHAIVQPWCIFVDSHSAELADAGSFFPLPTIGGFVSCAADHPLTQQEW